MVTGVHGGTIITWCGKAQVLVSRDRMTAEEKEKKNAEVIELAKEGNITEDIYRITGISRSAIKKWCEDAGVTRAKKPKVKKNAEKIRKSHKKSQIILELRKLGYDSGNKLSLLDIEKLAKEIGIKYGYGKPRRLAIDVFSVHNNSYSQLLKGVYNQVTISLDRKNERRQLISSFKEKAKECRYYSFSEIENFCEENDIDIEFFIADFMARGYNRIIIERYKKAIESNPNGIYIGPRIPLSESFIKQHEDELKEMCENVSSMICATYKESKEGQYIANAWEFAVQNLGNDELNFNYPGSDFPIIYMMRGSVYGHLNTKKIIENAEAKKTQSHIEFTYKGEEKEQEIIIPDNTYNPEDVLLQEESGSVANELVDQAMSGDEIDDKVLQILYEHTKHSISSREKLIELIAQEIDVNAEQVLDSMSRIGELFRKRGLVKETGKGDYILAID